MIYRLAIYGLMLVYKRMKDVRLKL